MLMDVPLAADHLSKIISALVLGDILPLRIIATEGLDDLKKTGSQAKLVELVCKEIIASKGEAHLSKLVNKGKVDLQHAMKPKIEFIFWAAERVE